MKNKRKRILATLCAGALFISQAAAISIQDFPDASGHWAYDALSRAVDEGLLQGSDGLLLPSGSLTGAQMAAILNRVLDAQNTDRSYPNTAAGLWYSQDASKAASLGILPLDGSLNLSSPVTRAQVFPALTAAFGLDEAAPDESVLNAFSDATTLTRAQRRAAAVLVRDGILSGSQDGTLQASRGITRAEFVSLIYRILDPSYLTLSNGQTEETTAQTPAQSISKSGEEVDTPESTTAQVVSKDTSESTDKQPDQTLSHTPTDETDGTSEQPSDTPTDGTEDTSEQTSDTPTDGTKDTSEQPSDTPTDETEDTSEQPSDTPTDETEDTSEQPSDTPTDETEDTSEQPSDTPTDGTEDTSEDPPVSEETPQTDSPVSVFFTAPTQLASSYDRMVLRGEDMGTVFTGDQPISVHRLTIATTGNPFVLSNENGNSFGTVSIGGGTGAVTLNGNVTSQVEITGSDRTIVLNGMQLDSLIISGSGNTIIADSQTVIKDLRVTSDALSNYITVDGTLSAADIGGARTSLVGAGHAGTIFVTGKLCEISLSADTLDDSKVDNGLTGVTVTVSAPKVAPGGEIVATATIKGVDKARVCGAQWYLDGQPVAAFGNTAFEISEGRTSTYRQPITFTRNMVLEHTVGFVLTYQNPTTGENEKILAGATVAIENYPASHYLPSPAEVLAKVNPTYRSGNTDYSDDEKTVFVNAKGYSSPTQYLIWVSRSAQMVNVFEGSQGNWRLIHEFPCATGKSSTPTPVGVTYVTYKQTAWVTSSYTCRPIVRFYPNTGYAFHSRLYYPGTNTLKDASIGFPVSAGCVRMLDDGINWLYYNIPTRTTVVIY